MRRHLLPSLLFVLLAMVGAVRAQTVHWDPASGTLGVGQTTNLTLVFEGCSSDKAPSVPAVDGLTLQFAGRSENTLYTNGVLQQTVTFTYAARLTRKEAVDIPPFEVETNKGKVMVQTAHFEAGNATVGQSGLSIEQVASARLSTTPASVWAGEVFDLNYDIEVDESFRPEFGQGTVTWESTPLVAEDWAQPKAFRSQASDGKKIVLAYKSRALARTAGQVHLSSPHQLVDLRVGVTGFGFFQQSAIQEFDITGTVPSLEVKALPPAPQEFEGAVGEFTLASKVVPPKVAVGDPITWTVDLKGTGNWPDIKGLPPREVSRDFQVVQPKAKRTLAQGKLFDATLSEDIVLVPTKPGTYTLPAMTFVYFDPKKGEYETIRTQDATVEVTPAAAPAQAEPAQGPAQPSASTAQRPEPPKTIPKDPISGSELAPTLMTDRELLIGGSCLVALLPLVWILFALDRSRRNDPQRFRREAVARLQAGLASLPKEGPARTAALRAWQTDAGILLGLGSAAPSPETISDPAWQALWAEADRALYGAEGQLPDDWAARARTVLAATRVPRFSPVTLFRPRNLFPIGLLALALSASSVGRADGADLYRGGQFEAAELALKQRVAAQPLDWEARYDLSLALAQQDHWGEAAGHATAAFVQHPSDPLVQWQLALSSDRSGFVPSSVAEFLAPGIDERIAERYSPAQWQRILLAGIAVIVVAFILFLAGWYRKAPRRATAVISAVLLLGGAVLVGMAGHSIKAYGFAADARSVIVWRASTLRSVPTEAEVQQKSTPLNAGSIAIQEKTFINGWIRLRFENGQTGWVRSSEVIPLWR